MLTSASARWPSGQQSSSTERPYSPRERGLWGISLEPRDPREFVCILASLILAGRTDGTVYDAPDLYTIFPTDPDELFIELTLRKVSGWDPPFATRPFTGLGQPAVPNA